LNQSRGSNLADTLAEEYVSPDYLPRQLPATFNKLRRIIFGGTPDRQMSNFRMYQLMQALHATELEEYVLQHDTRITYLPFDRSELLANAFGSTVSATPGTAGTLTVIGAPVPDETTGVIYQRWRVLVTNGTTVTINQLAPAAQTSQTVSTYALTAGLSNLIALPASTLLFNFSGTPGDEWFVEAIAKPTRNMAEILVALQSATSDEDETVIFGQPLVEPYLTFSNLWRHHEEYAYQLGGLLLAMAFRTMEIPPA
jgi:hypothetical protein